MPCFTQLLQCREQTARFAAADDLPALLRLEASHDHVVGRIRISSYICAIHVYIYMDCESHPEMLNLE